jgi:hypothetical protein
VIIYEYCVVIVLLEPLNIVQNEYHLQKTLNIRWLYDKAPPKSYKSLSRRITIPATHLENVKYDRDLVNKLAKILHDLLCRMQIFPINLKFMWVKSLCVMC